MMTATSTSPVTGRLLFLAVLAWFFAMAVCGCTTVKDTAKNSARFVGDTSRKVTDAFGGGPSDLKPRIVLVGIEPQAAGGPIGFASYFHKSISDVMQTGCREHRIDGTVREMLRSPPKLRSGAIDGYSLSLLGRPRGVNFFVIGTLNDVRLLEEKTGFWLWKDIRYTIRAVMRVEIIDSATGTKALDETFAEDRVIEELRHQQLTDAGSIPLSELEPIMSRLMPEVGGAICSALRDQPWQGFIVSVDQKRIALSSGSAAGLSPGKVLDVYSSGPMIESKDGQRFLEPGDKIGEATVSSVTEDRAEAILNGSVRVGVGGTVRSKR